jgi:CRP/FNR family transcriptional regulator
MSRYQKIGNNPTAFLRKVLPFAKLSQAELQTLTMDLRIREYRKNEMICHQGGSSRRLYIIMEGKVRIFILTPAGEETTINILSTHDIIGEFSILDELPRSTMVKAINDCFVLEMDGERFLQHLHQMPNLSLGICRLLVEKIRWATNYAQAIARYDAVDRLLYIVLCFNQRFGVPMVVGKRYLLDLSLKQEELASLIGVSRGWVCRTFRKLHNRGLIQYQRGKIIILDLPQVEDELSAHLGIFDQAPWHIPIRKTDSNPLIGSG